MSRPLRWGVLGAARIADGVVGAIRANGDEVVALGCRDRARGEAFAAKHAIARLYAGYDGVLADPAVEAVYLPLPTALHAPWALRCAEAGKPTLVEKPFAMNVAEAQRVFAAFAARGLAVGEAFMYRFHPLTQRAHELVRGGALGALRLLRADFAVAIDAGDIRWQAELGGGALRDLGCYCVGIMRLLAGAEPLGVAARADLAADGVDAAFAGTLAFPDGVLGSFACSMRGQFACSYEALGDIGRVRVDRGGMVAWPGETFAIEQSSPQGAERIAVPAADHYALMTAAFARAVRGEAAYPLAAAETIANQLVIDALLAAVLPGRAAVG